MIVTLPWPPKELSPNARLHWAKKNLHKQRYRQACYWTAMADGIRPNVIHRVPMDVHLEFYPPDRRSRDWDNCLASMKSGLDGLADALGTDDKHWRLSMSFSDQIAGMVKVTIKCQD